MCTHTTLSYSPNNLPVDPSCPSAFHFCSFTYPAVFGCCNQGWVCPGLPGFERPWVRQSLSDTKAEVSALDFHPVCFLKKQRTALDQDSQCEMVRGTSANIQRAGHHVPEGLKGGLATFRRLYNPSAQEDSEGLTFFQLAVSVTHFAFCIFVFYGASEIGFSCWFL